jgi:arginyl-tRNA synthetase
MTDSAAALFSFMTTILSMLAERIRAAVPDAPDQLVSVAADTRFGDYQSNVAMQLAKARKSNPRALAQEIVSALEVGDFCEPPEIAGAGFINFRLQPVWVARRLVELAADPRLGVPNVEPRRVVVDFSSPNVAKPMHVGHIRSTILGDSLARIGAYLGHSVIRDNHIGDWGTQFGKLLIGWKNDLNRDALATDPIGEMERLYKTVNARCDAEPAVEEAARQEVVKLQNGDAENLAIWQQMLELSKVQFASIYQRLGIVFDHTLGESFYNPWLRSVVDELMARGIARESDGAWCVFSDGSSAEKEDPFLIQRDGEWQANPCLVRKADGAANYATTDLATLQYRVREWAPDEIVYVTDGRQQLHFRQIFAVFQRWMPEAAARVRLSHVWFGTILGEDGRPFKTRSGDTVKLADLLDEAEERAFAMVTEKNPELPEANRREIARIVGIGALKYADLLPYRTNDYQFVWDRLLSLQGNTAVYLMYSCVRIRGIFRRAELPDPATIRTAVTADTVSLCEPAELALVKKLTQFGEVLPAIFAEYRPSSLCNFLYELASAFHTFFEQCPVLKAMEPARSSRLLLCETTGRVLTMGLELLGIEVPEQM